VFNAVRRHGEANPSYRCHLRRLLLFRDANAVVDFNAVLRHVPALVDLTLFGWEYIRVAATSWQSLSRRLVNLELVGLGFNAVSVVDDSAEEGGNSAVFDVALLLEAVALRRLRLAGWGDTSLELDQLFAALPQLDSLYLEDVKISLKNSDRNSSSLKNSSRSSSSGRNSSCGRNRSSCRRRNGWRGDEMEIGHRLNNLHISHCSTAQVYIGLPPKNAR
jgi:hypothetical protein